MIGCNVLPSLGLMNSRQANSLEVSILTRMAATTPVEILFSGLSTMPTLAARSSAWFLDNFFAFSKSVSLYNYLTLFNKLALDYQAL